MANTRDNASGVFDLTIDGIPDNFTIDTIPDEVSLTESILSPILNMSVVIQDPIYHNVADHNMTVKDYDLYRGKNAILSMYHPEFPSDILNTTKVIYRMDNRNTIPRNNEQYVLRCCDQTLLTNQITRISKFYKSKTPSQITLDALQALGSTNNQVEETQPTRDYDSQNKHPFEIINAQADYALAGENDPSLLHFMTYKNGGTHHFESIKMMTQRGVVENLVFTENSGNGMWENNKNIVAYSFPCDFDLLTDLMNGYPGSSGAMSINPVTGHPVLDALKGALGFGGASFSSVFTNKGTEDHSSRTRYEDAIKYRAARLALISPDKIAINMTLPLNTKIHAGDMVNVRFDSKESPGTLEYGSGDYLVVSLTHSVKGGGEGSTIIDAVSRTVGSGVV